MLKKMIAVPVMALALAVATPVLAHTHTSTEGSCACSQKMGSLKDKLHLTDTQLTQIKEIKAANKPIIIASMEKLHAIRLQMHKLVTSDHVDEAKVDALVNEKAQVLSTMMKTRIMTKHKIYAILTPEQKQQFEKMLKKEMKHH